jgi:SARP family transcriptional regulator, regulator of embCAB operon
MQKVRVTLFGQTTAVLPDEQIVVDFGGARPRQILGILAAALGTPVSKDRLIEQLWDGNPPRTCIETLESYVALLRRRTGLPSGRKSPLATTRNGYVLDGDQVEVDLHTFRRQVRETGHATPSEALRGSEEALHLVTGPLFASEPYSDWAVRERDHFQTEYLRACNEAASHALEASRPGKAVEFARRAIASDAVCETSWELLIRGLAATGARSEALCAYLDLRETLAASLGSEPSPTCQALFADLLAQDGRESDASSTWLHEVRTLLDCLRDAVDGCSDLDLSPHDRRLTQRVRRLLVVA